MEKSTRRMRYRVKINKNNVPKVARSNWFQDVLLRNYKKLSLAAGMVIILITAWILSPFGITNELVPHYDTQHIHPDSVADLQEYFAEKNYTWPLGSRDAIPNLILDAIPKDIASLPTVHQRKILFIKIMLPIIHAELNYLNDFRQSLIDELNHMGKNIEKEKWFTELLDEYNVNEDSYIAQRKELLNRIDVLPTSLVLAQAAIESGWGTSRFAKDGNSLFGQWTFNNKKSLVPNKRDSGKNHRVKAFDTLRASVRAYIKNINSNRAYKELRDYRKQMRDQQQAYDPLVLARGLIRYSQQGQEYVQIIQTVLQSKEFVVVDRLD